MPESTQATVQDALDTYIALPTGDNYRALLKLAERYRELWIESHADGGAAPPRRAAARDGTTRYERKHEVTQLVYGIPVTLALQKRSSVSEAEPWWVLSWRSKYSAAGSNRRFYLTRDGCWKIPAQVALGMIQMMEGEDGLAAEYEDHRHAGDYALLESIALDREQRQEALRGVTGADEKWGAEPYFAITSHPNSHWQKVLLINTDDNIATFRSITRDAAYMPKKTLRPGADWWLDNSMMDVSVQEMRMLYRVLAQYCEKLDAGAEFAPE